MPTTMYNHDLHRCHAFDYFTVNNKCFMRFCLNKPIYSYCDNIFGGFLMGNNYVDFEYKYF